jgi:hypothetical protein
MVVEVIVWVSSPTTVVVVTTCSNTRWVWVKIHCETLSGSQA